VGEEEVTRMAGSFKLIFADWQSRPGRDETWLKQRRENFPDETLFRREYPETLDDVLLASEEMVFSQWAIRQCLNPDYEFPAPPIVSPRHRYIQMWDQGRKNDAAVGVCLDITISPYVLVDYRRFIRLPYPRLQAEIEAMYNRYPGTELYVGDDNTALGIVENLHVPANHVLSNQPLKIAAIGALKLFLEKRYLDMFPVPQLTFELSSYMWDDDGIVQDSVMALAFACLKAGPPLWGSSEIGTRTVQSRQISAPPVTSSSRAAGLAAGFSSSKRNGRYRSSSGQTRDADYLNR